MAKTAIEMLHDLEDEKEGWEGEASEELEPNDPQEEADSQDEESQKEEENLADDSRDTVKKEQFKAAIHSERQKRKSERDARIKAEQELEQLRAKLEGAKAETDDVDEIFDIKEDELNLLEEVHPGVKDRFSRARTKIENLSVKSREAEEASLKVQEERAREAWEEAMREARTIPELAYWEAEEPEIMELAQQIDTAFIHSGVYNGIERIERYKDVVAKVKQRLGSKADLPAVTSLNKDEPWAVLLQDDTPKEEKQGAKKAARPRVNTLDDIGSGAHSQEVDIDNLTGVELEEIANGVATFDEFVDKIKRARSAR